MLSTHGYTDCRNMEFEDSERDTGSEVCCVSIEMASGALVMGLACGLQKDFGLKAQEKQTGPVKGLVGALVALGRMDFRSQYHTLALVVDLCYSVEDCLMI